MVHKPFTDDGVKYCGWATGTEVIDGCGELWPCSAVRGAPACQHVNARDAADCDICQPAREKPRL
jgi:hypothetical protein